MIPSHRLKQMKRALRREVLAARDALGPDVRAERSRRIAERLLALPEVAAARRVLAFSSFGSEVDTAPILDGLLGRGVRVGLPRIAEGELVPVAYRRGDPVAEAPFGALEPTGGEVVDPATIDVVVTPGVAFDRGGGRVGYGAGFYDRLFRRVRPQAVRVAVAFALQVVPEVPSGAADVRVHAIVTEDEVLWCPPP